MSLGLHHEQQPEKRNQCFSWYYDGSSIEISLFVYTTHAFYFFPHITAHSPMLPLYKNFGLQFSTTGLTQTANAIEPGLRHPSGQGNWTFPENLHQRSISTPMGSSTTTSTPYVSYQSL